jgi:phage terminase large subunit GpA-like protein
VICSGDTTNPEVWAELDEALIDFGVQHAVIDSGYNTSMVYAFVQGHNWRVAAKGMTGAGRPLVEDPGKRRQRLRTRRRKGISPEPIGVDQGKAIIHARLRSQRVGPGYIHLPDHHSIDDEYVAQLGAEKLMTRRRQGRLLQEWVQIRPRNEALDCMVYALAAHRMAGWQPPARETQRAMPLPTKPPPQPRAQRRPLIR